MGKSKKGRNTKASDDADVDDIVNEIEGLKVGDNNKEAGDEATSKSKKNKKKKDKKKGWDEDELLDDIAALANDEGETESKPAQDQEEQAPTSKKNKKKKDKKKGWDEDELLDDIAALANDEGETESKPAQDQEEQAPTSKKDKKKGKKKKKGFDEDDIMDELAEMEAEMDGGKKVKSQISEEKEDSEETQKKPAPVEDKAEGEEESTGGVKTAAQKKAEKKEREKKKKEQQRLEAKNRKMKQEAKKQEGDGEEGKKDKGEGKAQAEDDTKDNEDAEEEGEEEEGDKKKKKKKKGKGGEEKEEKTKKGRMGKSQLKMMQELLQKRKEEEARLQAEEEAKIKAAEEAERIRQEKLQKEKEKKEKDRLRKKERIERMKKEGTYLTPAQKAAKARAEASLAAMRAQGIEIPQKDDGTPASGPKRVRYGTRQRKKQKGQESQEKESAMETESTASAETETQEDATTEATEDATTDATEEAGGEEEKKEEEKKEAEEEEVKDSWDISSEEEEEEEEKEDKPSPDEMPQKEITVHTKKKDEDGEEDEEEDDEEEDSSEEESDSEESDSEDESSSDSEDDRTLAEKNRERALERIKKRREENESKRNTDELRCPVVCVLGHVDTGKTKILDKIRHTNVQDGEAGGITQQIGATRVPDETIKEQTKMCRQFAKTELKFPGLLIIDTPGHESFSNLRSRGSSLCDIAILVVDIMHGLEPQTIESLNLLRSRKTPFIVALNKIDRLFEWKSGPNTDIANVIKKQKKNTKDEFDERFQKVALEFAEQGMNAALFYDNPDPKSYISLVPTSAHSGDGMGNLIALICELSQTMLAKRLSFSETLQCTTLEVKALPGLGTTIDVVLVNGRIHEGDTMVLAGQEGVITTQVRGLLMPQPLRELRVKNAYEHYKELKGAQGIKILAKDLDKALAGMPLLIAEHPDEVDILKEEVAAILKDALKSIKLSQSGVFVQASTLGSLEALLEFLKTSKIPYAGINIGPVHKRDVMKASVMLEHDNQYAVILAFDVKVEREAQEMADREGIKIFQADIIYHLFDRFTAHREALRLKKREEFKHIAVFPCKLKILPQCIFNARNPIVVGVTIEGGIVKEGTPICVPSRENLNIGVISSIESNHKQVETARKGQEVCIKIENIGNDAPKMVGRHFEAEDLLISKISRESINAVKNYFREDLEKSDWVVMIELKKILQIL